MPAKVNPKERGHQMAFAAWHAFRWTPEDVQTFAQRIAEIAEREGLQAAAEAIADDCRRHGLQMSARRVLKNFASYSGQHRDLFASPNFSREVTVSDLDKFYEYTTGRVPISIIKEVWFLENISEIERGFYETIKRGFDILLGIIFIAITIIIFPIAAIGIKIFDPGPIFYRQIRVGKNGRIFTLTKFRSLPITKKTEQLMKKPPENAITSFGKFLRKLTWTNCPKFGIS